MKKFSPEPEYGIQWYHVLGAALIGIGVVCLASPKIAGYIVLAIVAYALWSNVIESH
ncbi:MAG: hypothetical protein ACK4FA_02490 [Candidatus Paceibacteria bacterium]